MSGGSSSREAWWSLLEPAPAEVFFGRGDPEDPRLGEVVQRWTGGPIELGAGQPVLIGFPCDEGVRRNGGRVGAAGAPNAIREQLYRLTPWEPLGFVEPPEGSMTAECDLQAFDLGNVRITADLETSQLRLGEVVAAVFAAGGVPILLGGGHETAFGHYLGYAKAGMECAIINIDAHLDVRRYPNGGHSGSPFRQAMEYEPHPLKAGRYTVIGTQTHCTAKAHYQYLRDRGDNVHWASTRSILALEEFECFLKVLAEAAPKGLPILLTVDADAFRQGDVPGMSAPNPLGLEAALWPALAGVAGGQRVVRSLELVEVNPKFDRDNQTTRWAALGIRQFLVGLNRRAREDKES